MVPLCNGIMADAVHPQSGKYQTACATVQGQRSIQRWLSSGGTTRGNGLVAT